MAHDWQGEPAMPSYKDYQTPTEFNTGYANSITPEVISHWEQVFRQESKSILEEVSCRQNLIYGPRERNRIDFFPAQTTNKEAPLLVVIHGGLWFLFDKWMMHFLAKTWTERGYHVAAINYPLAPDHSLGEIVADCRAAVFWLYDHAQDLGILREAITVLGHSAAGQLGAMVASTDWQKYDATLPRQIIHRSIGISGFYDIDPFGLTDFQPMVGFTVEDYRRWNPLNQVTEYLPKTLLITGEKESSLLHQMAQQYAQALHQKDVPTEIFVAEGECHFSVLHQLANPTSAVFERVFSHLKA